MNKTRLKRIGDVLARMEEVKEEVAAIMEEEQEALDNMPEGIQSSERGDHMQNVIDTLSDAESDIDNAISGLEGI